MMADNLDWLFFGVSVHEIAMVRWTSLRGPDNPFSFG
jgi:hypothetical protein